MALRGGGQTVAPWAAAPATKIVSNFAIVIVHRCASSRGLGERAEARVFEILWTLLILSYCTSNPETPGGQ